MDNQTTRICKTCKKERPITDYYTSYYTKTGARYRDSTCNYCRREQQKERYAKKVGKKPRDIKKVDFIGNKNSPVARALNVLAYIYHNPYTTTNEIVELCDVAKSTAYKTIRQLREAGINIPKEYNKMGGYVLGKEFSAEEKKKIGASTGMGQLIKLLAYAVENDYRNVNFVSMADAIHCGKVPSIKTL